MTQIAQYLGTGKRKTSVARVILRPGDGTTWINGRTLEDYFPRAHPPRPWRSRRSTSPRRRAPTTCACACTAAASAARPARSATASPARSSRPIPSSACRSSGRASSRATPARSSARRPACTRRARRRSSRSAERPIALGDGRSPAPRAAGAARGTGPSRGRARVLSPTAPHRERRLGRARAALQARHRMTAPTRQHSSMTATTRLHFGTDGVRGVVGETLTEELVERLGKAVDALVGPRPRADRARHARLRAGARGCARRAGSSRRAGRRVLAGVLPTPAVALLAQDLGTRRLRLAQPARVQRRQGLRPARAEAHRRAGARDRGAARRARERRRERRARRRRGRRVPRRTSSSTSAPT